MLKHLKAKLVLIVNLWLLGIGPNVVSAAPVSHAEAVQIKAEIKQLADDYAVYRDNNDAVGYANVFAEDGKFIFRGEVFAGRAVLQKRVEDADQSGVSMHMMSSSQIQIIDENNATGVHYAAIYSVKSLSGTKEGDTISVDGPSIIGKYQDSYIRTAEGWKFAERSFMPVFKTAQ